MNNIQKLLAIFAASIILLAGMVSCGDDDPVNPSKSSEKTITSFVFNQLTPPITATINNADNTISAKVPFGTDITTLVPTIVISDKATISPASGTAVDFTLPVTYTVTAEDNTTQSYVVTVTVDDNTVVEPITLEGYITENRTLSDRGLTVDYIVNEYLFIDGNALLTIEAGVTIMFTEVSYGMDVMENAGLKITGTAEKPVIFTGPTNNQNPGAWRGINIYSNRADNVWEYAIIENGGDSDGEAAVELYSNTQLTMKHCEIRGAGDWGLYLQTDAKLKNFEYNVIKNCNRPIYLENIKQAAYLDNTSSFAENTKPYIYMYEFTGDINEDLTLKKLDVPYHTGSIFITDCVLTIEPGCELIFESNAGIRTWENGYLIADGTAAEPIIFTGKSKNAGYWSGIELSHKMPSILNNCTIEYAGIDDGYGLYVANGKVDMNNTTISHSGGYGVVMGEESEITHSNITFIECELGNVYNETDDTVVDELP